MQYAAGLKILESMTEEDIREGEQRQKELDEAVRARRIESERKSWGSLFGKIIGFSAACMLAGGPVNMPACIAAGKKGMLLGDFLTKSAVDIFGTVGGKSAESYFVSETTGAWGGAEEGEMINKYNKLLQETDEASGFLGDVLKLGEDAITMYGMDKLMTETGSWFTKAFGEGEKATSFGNASTGDTAQTWFTKYMEDLKSLPQGGTFSGTGQPPGGSRYSI